MAEDEEPRPDKEEVEIEDPEEDEESYTAEEVDEETYIHAEEADGLESPGLPDIDGKQLLFTGLGVLLVIGIIGGLLLFSPFEQEPASNQMDDDSTDNMVPDIIDDRTDPTEFEDDVIEQEIHDRVNEIRSRNNLSPLTYDSELAFIAANHTRDMLERDYFSHVSPEEDNYKDRYAAAGYNCSIQSEFFVYYGEENLARISLDPYTTSTLSEDEKLFQIAKRVVATWMNADRYRENLLQPFWEHHGIGSRIENTTLYVTQNYC